MDLTDGLLSPLVVDASDAVRHAPTVFRDQTMKVLFLATGFAAYLTGSLVATLVHLDDEIRPPQAPNHAEHELPRTDMEGGAR